MRALAISWDSIRRWAQRMSAELLLAISPELARWSHGPRLRPDAGQVLDGTGPLLVTLAPDLKNDETTRLIVSLGSLDHVEVLVSPECAARLDPALQPATWSLVAPNENGVVGVEWDMKGKHRQLGLFWFNNVELDRLATRFPDELGADPTTALAMFRALQVHHRHHGGHLFVTRSPGILAARSLDRFPREIGQCTPEEALVTIGILLRQRNTFPQAAHPLGDAVNSSPYDWYCGVAQMLMPRYRDVFQHLAQIAESRKQEENKALAYLEGVATRCRQLLRAHDRLGFVHFGEADRGSNNLTSEAQTEDFYNSIDSAVGMLEGLAVLVAELEGHITTGKEWRTVTFPALRQAQLPWVKSLVKYGGVVPAVTSSWTPILSLAIHERKQSFHYYPVVGRSLKFGEVISASSPDGIPLNRFLERVNFGCIKPVQQQKDLSWITQGTDGMLMVENQLYLLPWLFIRAVMRDLLNVVDAVLGAVATADGITLSGNSTEILSSAGQDLAQRMLALDQSLQG